MRKYTTKKVLMLILIAIPDILLAQQFEIRYNNTVLNSSDTVVYIPSEQDILNDFCHLSFQVCNLTDSNLTFLICLDGTSYSCGFVYDDMCVDCALPWISQPWLIDPNSCGAFGPDITLSHLTNPPQEFFDIKIWDTSDVTTMKTIHVYPYDTTIYPIVIPPPAPSLCMVSVQNGYNTLIWNEEGEVLAYNLYRESNVSGEYEQIATIPYGSTFMWVDSSSRPTTRSYRYRISAVNNGGESQLSSVHKTMHLTINQGYGGRWNLSWTPYEGSEYTTYFIYRGTDATNLEQIDIMPADGNTSYTDETAPQGDVYYQVGIVMRSPCSGGNTKSNSISLSNIATNSSVGISSVVEESIYVYSRDGRVIIEGADEEQVKVFDMLGKCVGDCSHVLPDGVYMVKIGNHPARKVVVIR